MTDDTSHRKLLETARAALRAADAVLTAVLEREDTQPQHDALLSTAETLKRFGLGHEAIRAAAERGELAVQRGSRGKYLVLESELRRYLASRPLRPTPRRTAPVENLDAWEADADRALRLSEAASDHRSHPAPDWWAARRFDRPAPARWVQLRHAGARAPR